MDPMLFVSILSFFLLFDFVLYRHLKTNATDPFTRLPMCMEDIVPHIELKNEIRIWKLTYTGKGMLMYSLMLLLYSGNRIYDL